MNIELVTIGTELLLGFTSTPTAPRSPARWRRVGVRVVRRTAWATARTPSATRSRTALARTGAVLTTGGLGPTRDDISKSVVAELFGMPLEFDEADLGRSWSRASPGSAGRRRRATAVRPRCRGAPTCCHNRWGTAPGLWLEGAAGAGHHAAWRAGRDAEAAGARGVPAAGGAAAADGVIRSRVVRTTGIPESTLAERLGEIEGDVAPLTLAYLPGFDGVDLRLSAWRLPPEEADARLAAGGDLLRERAGSYVYGEGDDDLAALVLDASAGAAASGSATAESCTGGWSATRLTEIPGKLGRLRRRGRRATPTSSRRAARRRPGAGRARDGAVSEAVARAMALGALRAAGRGPLPWR